MKAGSSMDQRIGTVALVVRDYNESYATAAQFRDLYGNKWDLLHRK